MVRHTKNKTGLIAAAIGCLISGHTFADIVGTATANFVSEGSSYLKITDKVTGYKTTLYGGDIQFNVTSESAGVTFFATNHCEDFTKSIADEKTSTFNIRPLTDHYNAYVAREIQTLYYLYPTLKTGAGGLDFQSQGAASVWIITGASNANVTSQLYSNAGNVRISDAGGLSETPSQFTADVNSILANVYKNESIAGHQDTNVYFADNTNVNGQPFMAYYNIAAVPEPASLTLLALAFPIFMRRKKKHL